MFLLKRHAGGPILIPDPNLAWELEGIFNPGVIENGEEVVMLYRAVGETDAYVSHLGLAKSKDGITWQRASDAPVFGPKEEFDKWATEDPRITKIGDDFFITYVAVADRIMQGGKSFPREKPLEVSTALLKTRDFQTFENLGIISPKSSDNKDIVLFPKKINGRYCMLHRPNYWHRTWCDHLKSEGQELNWSCSMNDLPQFPAIWIAWSDDLRNWADHKVFMFTSHHGDSKIGPGLPPIETEDGWLVIYQHVTETPVKDALFYSVRAALFDLKDPLKMIGKLHYDILAPEMPYEKERKSAIVFPTGGFVRDGELFVYYGASDKYIGLATGPLEELLSELKKSNQIKA